MEKSSEILIVAEESGINLQNEGSLHAGIKAYYAKPEDRFEVKVDRSIIDIVRGDLLIEIQTGNFGSIRKKLQQLVKNHPIRLLYPIPHTKWIVRLDPKTLTQISRRKSPKRGKIYELFKELIRIPTLLIDPNFSLEVLLVEVEEIRCPNGKGSWRRKGESIIDRRLLSVVGHQVFTCPEDFLGFLPDTLPTPFSSKHLSETLHIPLNTAQKIIYCLKKMEAIVQEGKSGNTLLYTKRP